MFDKVPTHVLSDSVAQQLLDKIEAEGVLPPRQGHSIFVTANANIRPLRIDFAEGDRRGHSAGRSARRRACRPRTYLQCGLPSAPCWR